MEFFLGIFFPLPALSLFPTFSSSLWPPCVGSFPGFLELGFSRFSLHSCCLFQTGSGGREIFLSHPGFPALPKVSLSLSGLKFPENPNWETPPGKIMELGGDCGSGILNEEFHGNSCCSGIRDVGTQFPEFLMLGKSILSW